MRTVEHTAPFESKRKSLIRQDKLQRLPYNRSDNRLEVPTDRWVVNISSKPLSDLDKKALSHGFKFAITPKSQGIIFSISLTYP